MMEWLQENSLLCGGIVLLILSVVTLLFVISKKKSERKEAFSLPVPRPTAVLPKSEPALESKSEVAVEPEQRGETQLEPIAEVEEKWVHRLTKGLTRSRQLFWGKLGDILKGQHLGEAELEAIEEILYGADLGPKLVAELTAELHAHLLNKESTLESMKAFLREFLWERLFSIQQTLPANFYEWTPPTEGNRQVKVILVAGINGAGKTTTIGKLATKYARQGASVYVGACDTFRAAAVDQLQVWCDRAGAKMIRAKEGSDPSGVAYETLQCAVKENADICLLDTAGRLHTKSNLMDELKKLEKVLSKVIPDAPHHVALVLDAITGQNAVRQAQEFHKILNVTELILTKCDGSSKAGSVVGIMQELKIPVSYIGIGESVDDLQPFSLDEYLSALLDYHF